MISIGFDPDSHATSWGALEYVQGSMPRVIGVGVVKVPASYKGFRAVREMAREMQKAELPFTPDILVVEGQQIYEKGKAKPDHILQLAQVAGGVFSHCLGRWPRAESYLPRPMQWKAQVPKRVHQARVWEKLGFETSGHGHTQHGYSSPKDGGKIPTYGRVTRSDWKHIGDAVGLALWGIEEACGKFRKIR